MAGPGSAGRRLQTTILSDLRIYSLLEHADRDLAARARAKRCALCGGRLDGASYRRKPRAPLPGWDRAGWDRRASFCCAHCRKRTTPPSVRFLGRRVYAGAVVVLASAMRHGLTRARVRELRRVVDVPARTLERWRCWWLDTFVRSRFWRATRGLFAPPADESVLPLSILERMDGADQTARLVQTLLLLSPITTRIGQVDV